MCEECSSGTSNLLVLGGVRDQNQDSGCDPHSKGIINEAEIDDFLELPCFSYDPTNFCNLISGPSASLKLKLCTCMCIK